MTSSDTPKPPKINRKRAGVASAATCSALDLEILEVMKTARMTYHIANCLRASSWIYGDITTARVRHRLQALEKRGLVSRTESPYKTQISWKQNDTAQATQEAANSTQTD